MKVAFTIIAGLMLGACAQNRVEILLKPEPKAPESAWEKREPDSCGAGDVAALKGQTAAMVEASHLMNAYRVIPEGSIVTQEYNAARLNFYLDSSGVVTRIACG